MRFSYLIILLLLCFGISKAQNLKETVRDILKRDELKEDIKNVILHLLKNDENLKRNIIEILKEDVDEDLEGKGPQIGGGAYSL